MAKKMNVKVMSEFCKAQNLEPVKISFDVGDESVEITVKRILSFKEACDFVSGCTYACFSEDDYFPHLRDFAFLREVLTAYTDCKLPTDEEAQYKIIFGLPDSFYEKLYKVIDTTQISSLKQSIADAIDFEKEKLLKKSRLLSMLEKVVSEMQDVMKPENVQKLTDMADKIQGVSQEDVVTALLSYGKQ